MPPRTYDFSGYKGAAEAAVSGFGKAFITADDQRLKHRDQALQEALSAVAMQDRWTRMGIDADEAGGQSPTSPLAGYKAQIGGMLGNGGYQAPQLQDFKRTGPTGREREAKQGHDYRMIEDTHRSNNDIRVRKADAEAMGVRPGQEMQRHSMREQFLDDLFDRSNGDVNGVMQWLGRDPKRMYDLGITNSDLVAGQGRYKNRKIARQLQGEKDRSLIEGRNARTQTLMDDQGRMTSDGLPSTITPEQRQRAANDPEYAAFLKDYYKNR
jgi:hypothetical protein